MLVGHKGEMLVPVKLPCKHHLQSRKTESRKRNQLKMQNLIRID